MVRFLIQRILVALTVLLTVSVAVFALIHLSGDPLDGFTPPGAPEEVRAALRAELGLDEPAHVQLASFLRRAIQGDLGQSWRNDEPALAIVLDRVPATIGLAASALSIALVLGVTGGVALHKFRHPLLRAPLISLVTLGQATPAFWLGAVLILLFAVRLKWLPSSGGDGIEAVILPAVALALMPSTVLARLVSTELDGIARSDAIRTARGKGLSERAVMTGHALRLAALPALAYLGLQTGFLLGGAVVIEGVFAYPGLGLLALNAASDRDLPVIQAFVLVAATAIMLVNLAVDLLARLVDPRLRTEPGH